jgi:PAS domain S-box-containing protein
MCRRDLPTGAVVCPHCQRDLNVGPWAIGFVLIWVVLIASAALSYRQTAQLVGSQGLIDNTYRVLIGLQSIVGTLTEAETAQRGFIITGDRRYLELYQTAAAAVPRELAAVRALLSDNPGQQQRLDAVERTARERLDTIAHSIAERQAPDGFERGRAVVASGRGKLQMDAVRARIGEMQRVEEALLEGREEHAAQRFHVALISNLTSTAVAALMVGLVFVLVRRVLTVRQRSAFIVANERERYRITLASIGDAVIVTNPAGTVTFMNRIAEELTGWDGDAIGRPLAEVFRIINEQSRDTVESPVDKVLRDGVIVGLANHTLLVRRDGSEVAIDDSGAPVRDRSGAMTGVVLVFRDISERRGAERTLVTALERTKEAGARLQRVAAASLTINASQSLASIAGVVAEEARSVIPSHQSYGSIVVDDAWDDALAASAFSEKHAELRDRQIPPFRVDAQVWEPRKPIRLTEAERTEKSAWWMPDAHPSRPALRGWLAVPLVGRDGRILGAIQLSDRADDGEFSEDDEAILQQLANLAAIAIENSRLYDALRDADRRKDEFLAMLSHELRNPLAPIRNALHILRFRARGDGVLEETSAMMMRQVDHMVRLVDDLLDVSRITRGKIVLQREPVDASTIVNRAVEASRPAIESRHHALTVSFAHQPLPVEVDLTRLAQVVTNLLNNAAKFTPEYGRIEINTKRTNGDAAIEVKDNGAGIPADMLPIVFDLFVQSGRTIDGSQGGLGIGLTLVRRLTEMHGGTVTASSEGPGRGSTFTVRLPLASAKTATRDEPLTVPRASDGPPPRGLRVLVVDDNRDSADSLRMLLGALGNDAKTAYDGQRALELAVDLGPELVVLDIGLPGMSGYDVAKRLRQMPETADAVIVALTGYGSESDRHRSAEAGFDDHLVKPVDFTRLEELLARTRRVLADREESRS